MSVPEQDPVTLHTGNGVTTVFAYQFLLTLAADLVVTVAGVVKTLNVDYTVSGLGIESGGDVAFTVAPASMASIILRRVIALERDTDYQNFGDFKAETVNADFDRLWMATQGVKEEVDRSIRVAPDSPAVNLELPAPVALTYLRWNSLATRLEAVLLADISLISLTAYAQTLLDAVDAAAARLVLGITTFGSTIVTAANAAAARTAMGAAGSGANNDITSLTALTAGGLPNSSVLTADIADANVTPAKLSQPLTAGTLQATTSGTSKDFTGIPSWAKRVTLQLLGVSTNGTSSVMAQLGTASGIETTGYTATGGIMFSGPSVNVNSYTTGFSQGAANAGFTLRGSIVFTLIDPATNTWVCNGLLVESGILLPMAGSKALAGVLDRVRLTTVNGTDAFDAGSVNILYE